MVSKINVNNAAVDAVWRDIISGGLNAEKTGYYGDNQITVREPNGRMVYSVKVVGVTRKDAQTIFNIPQPKNYDVLAVVLFDDDFAAMEANSGKLVKLDVRYIDPDKIYVSTMCWPKYPWHPCQLSVNSCHVDGLGAMLDVKLGQIAKQIASNPPKTLPGRIARVEKVLGDPLALVQQTITFG